MKNVSQCIAIIHKPCTDHKECLGQNVFSVSTDSIVEVKWLDR